MKITGLGGPRDVAGKQKAKKTGGGGDFADNLQDVSGSDDSGAATGASGVAAVTGLIAAQDVGNALDGRSRGLLIDRGERLLDRLDEIRVAVLEGSVAKDKLVALAQHLREKRQKVDDPGLEELIDEIELRAEVELAKLTRQ